MNCSYLKCRALAGLTSYFILKTHIFASLNAAKLVRVTIGKNKTKLYLTQNKYLDTALLKKRFQS